MVAYQLPTGKTIFINSNDLLSMTDLDEQELIANDVGFFINNPFSNISSDGTEENIEEINREDIPELDNEIDFDI